MLIMLDSPLTLLIVAVWGVHVRNEPSIALLITKSLWLCDRVSGHRI